MAAAANGGVEGSSAEDLSEQRSPFANSTIRGEPAAIASLASAFGGSSSELSKLQGFGSFPSIPQVWHTLCFLPL